MKARGKTKEILEKVGEVQSLIGSAISRIDTLSQYEIRALLENAHELCIEIRDMYEPVD